MSRRRLLIADHVSKVLGGAEVNLVELLAHPAVPERWDVTVACSPDSPLDQALAARGIRREPYGFAPALNELRLVGRGFAPMAKLRGMLELRRASQKLSGLLDSIRPDAVLTPTNKDHFAAGSAAKPLGIPSVWWVNDLLTPDFFSWPVRRVFTSRARSLATRLLPVSQAGAEALVQEGIPSHRITPIPNGIPLARYARTATRPLRVEVGLHRGEPLIGVVGRITPWKGQDLFVQIANAWAKAGRSGRFVVIGRAFNEDEAYEARVRAAVSAAGLGSRVHFVPFQSDIAAALSSLDVLLHTSLKPEPFGRVVIEAMAAGTPVIAARAGGIPGILTHGVDGLMANPGDVQDYVRQLALLTEDPGLGDRLSAAALKKVAQNFSLDRVFQDFESVFESLPPVPRR